VSAPRAPAAAARDSGIDALRGVAILLVIAYHAGPLAFRLPPLGPDGWLVVPRLGAAWLAVPLFHFGFAGVHLFFVLSGFCIHASCHHGRDFAPAAPGQKERARRYAYRRLMRIAPPYYLALAAFAWVLPALSTALARPAAPAAAWDVGVHALFAHGLSPRTIFSINPAFWSLATEMQFYAVYPLVAWAGLRFGLSRLLLAALLLSLAWRAAVLALVPPTLDHFMVYRVWVHGFFVPRWFEWILGCWLAETAAGTVAGGVERPRLPPARPAALAGAALLVLAMATRVHVVIDKLLADSLFSLGFALVIAAVLGRERARAAVGRGPGGPLRALCAVGRRSYGTYLVHQPILDGDWLPLLPRLLLTAAASALFSRFAERPFERWARRGPGRPGP